MKISFQNAGIRFNKDWIFRNVDDSISPGEHISILGGNGSGKSTFLRSAMGFLSLSEGRISFFENEKEIAREEIYKYTAVCAPYQELYDEFSLVELIRFQKAFKPFLQKIDPETIPAIAQLEKHAHKPVKYFSSGMKQRVRIALAVLADSPLLFLDEPTSNLDSNGAQWYRDIISTYKGSRTILVASNQQHDEYFFCNRSINLSEKKTA